MLLWFAGTLLVQRWVELIIAQKNAAWMFQQGGYERGREHYKYIVFLHGFFFISLIAEGSRSTPPSWWFFPAAAFMLAQILRYWSISSLGRFWNTRIIILPNAPVVTRGPYRFLRHPNYLVVITELLAIPLIFGAYGTAVTVSLVNLLLLRIRIQTEEKSLTDGTDYAIAMNDVPRLIPAGEGD
ncbi:isoprenylcysteine carboxyl methyltransferase [Heliobacterium chlorum]|uniref:Isoprenylcysteine carboxyl methyltransferase n=1 Tax=Heliobacterium chlorum TaxID=2698 RepID=A0ABR7SYC3_HELCL|nr:isoprenylcysteine carboxylmethyltransferase family protein [Heliobacterium chlorum]MBC9782952.1 isoprenylcysteine carboxyl methyltransferase [Heliobacterium chlorum]